MSGGRPRRVGIGDRVLADGRPTVVIGIAGTRVRMADEDGTVTTATIAELVASPRFELPAVAPASGSGPVTGLEGLPAAAVEEASWWEPHITEVVYGTRQDVLAGAHPRPEYDPGRTTLTGRERAKAAELTAAGRPVTASTVKHRRQRWEAHGLAGLVDYRAARRMRPQCREVKGRVRLSRMLGLAC